MASAQSFIDYVGKLMDYEFYWTPEAPEFPGLYANLKGTDIPSNNGLAICTYDINSARLFKTYLECKEWCEKNPFPYFVPREHGIG